MWSNFYKDIESIKKYFEINPWTNVYGFARSSLALSLLITLVFTGQEYLFPTVDNLLMKQPLFSAEKVSIFWLFKNNLSIAYYLSIFILTWVISGYLPQMSGFLHWWISLSYISSGIIIEGGDQIAAIISFFLIPVTLTDNRVNHWNKPKQSNRSLVKFFIWSVYAIIILQVSIIYLHASTAKLSVNEWLNGTAVYYWFTHNVFGVSEFLRPMTYSLLSNTVIVVLISWGTIILELLLFGWLFMKRNNWNWKFLFLMAFSFHFCIAMVHGLFSFFLSMVGALTLYFFPKNIHLNFKKWKHFI